MVIAVASGKTSNPNFTLVLKLMMGYVHADRASRMCVRDQTVWGVTDVWVEVIVRFPTKCLNFPPAAKEGKPQSSNMGQSGEEERARWAGVKGETVKNTESKQGHRLSIRRANLGDCLFIIIIVSVNEWLAQVVHPNYGTNKNIQFQCF